MSLNKDSNDLKFAPLYLEDPFTLDSTLVNAIKRFEDLDNNINTLPSIKNTTLNLDNNLDSRNLSLDSLPFTPYPLDIQNLEASQLNETDFDNFIPFNQNNDFDDYSEDEDDYGLNYPNNIDDNNLFPYNRPQFNSNTNAPMINPINILRNLNTDDIEPSDNMYRNSHKANEINDIFKKIEDENTIIIATMKAYRIPYPIAKLLVKKIISLTLKYKG